MPSSELTSIWQPGLCLQNSPRQLAPAAPAGLSFNRELAALEKAGVLHTWLTAAVAVSNANAAAAFTGSDESVSQKVTAGAPGIAGSPGNIHSSHLARLCLHHRPCAHSFALKHVFRPMPTQVLAMTRSWARMTSALPAIIPARHCSGFD